MFDRFKGEVVMTHNENNEHKCTGCGICGMNCPNGSIEIISKRVLLNEDGKRKELIDKHIYHLACALFVLYVLKPALHMLLTFSQEFEHAVFDRTNLLKC